MASPNAWTRVRSRSKSHPVCLDLVRGASGMAVGASDLAFLDLCGYVRPCSCLADERRDVRGLSATVVEVQDKRISHSAIDTRMRVEIFDDAPLQHRSDFRRIAVYPSRVGGLIAYVPGARDLALARQADVLSGPLDS